MYPQAGSEQLEAEPNHSEHLIDTKVSSLISSPKTVASNPDRFAFSLFPKSTHLLMEQTSSQFNQRVRRDMDRRYLLDIIEDPEFDSPLKDQSFPQWG